MHDSEIGWSGIAKESGFVREEFTNFGCSRSNGIYKTLDYLESINSEWKSIIFFRTDENSSEKLSAGTEIKSEQFLFVVFLDVRVFHH